MPLATVSSASTSAFRLEPLPSLLQIKSVFLCVEIRGYFAACFSSRQNLWTRVCSRVQDSAKLPSDTPALGGHWQELHSVCLSLHEPHLIHQGDGDHSPCYPSTLCPKASIIWVRSRQEKGTPVLNLARTEPQQPESGYVERNIKILPLPELSSDWGTGGEEPYALS